MQSERDRTVTVQHYTLAQCQESAHLVKFQVSIFYSSISNWCIMHITVIS